MDSDTDTEEIIVSSYKDILNKKQKSINELEHCLINLEKEREVIEKNINFLWEKVMEPYIEFKADLILLNNIDNIKLNFYKLLYHNSNIEKQIIHIIKMIDEQYLLNFKCTKYTSMLLE